jgi:glycosyltransferase involved in cell wall biosynthesis
MPDLAELLARRMSESGTRVLRVRTNLRSNALRGAIDRVRGVRSIVRFIVYLGRLVAALPSARIVHTLSHSGLAFLLFTAPAVVLGRLTGRRVIVNYHGGNAGPFLQRHGWWARSVLRMAHVVAVPSRFLADVFSAEGIATELLPNLIETDKFAWRGDDPRVQPPTILVARHLEPIYNVACAIRAFAIVRREFSTARLVVLGSGSEAAALRELATDLRVDDAVEFTGYVAHERIGPYYERASVFLNTSNVDNVPISILEAFATGLPVVTTRAGGIPYVVTDGRTGYVVDLNDDGAAAERILRLLRDDEHGRVLARAARRTLETNSWPAVHQRLAELYLPHAT